jgi:hypothetical protein
VYAFFALLVPAGILLGVATSDLVAVMQTGMCPPIAPAVIGTPCGVGEFALETLFGPKAIALTGVLTAAWAIALAMAFVIFLTMRSVLTPPPAEAPL